MAGGRFPENAGRDRRSHPERIRQAGLKSAGPSFCPCRRDEGSRQKNRTLLRPVLSIVLCQKDGAFFPPSSAFGPEFRPGRSAKFARPKSERGRGPFGEAGPAGNIPQFVLPLQHGGFPFQPIQDIFTGRYPHKVRPPRSEKQRSPANRCDKSGIPSAPTCPALLPKGGRSYCPLPR